MEAPTHKNDVLLAHCKKQSNALPDLPPQISASLVKLGV